MTQNAPESSDSAERLGRARSQRGQGFASVFALVSLGVAVLLGSLVASTYARAWGLVGVAVLISVAVLIGYRAIRHRARIPLWPALGLVAAEVMVGGLVGLDLRQTDTSPNEDVTFSLIARAAFDSVGVDASQLPCSPAYSLCVREMPWVRNCDDKGFQVIVIVQRDPFGLDRDADGIGWSAFPESTIGEQARE